MHRNELPSPLSSEADIKIPKHKLNNIVLEEHNYDGVENAEYKDIENESYENTNTEYSDTDLIIDSSKNKIENNKNKPKKRGRKKKTPGKYFPLKTIYEYDTLEKLTPRQQILYLRRKELLKQNEGKNEIPCIPVKLNVEDFLESIRKNKKRRNKKSLVDNKEMENNTIETENDITNENKQENTKEIENITKKNKKYSKKKILPKVNIKRSTTMKIRHKPSLNINNNETKIIYNKDKTKLRKILRVMDEENHKCIYFTKRCKMCEELRQSKINFLDNFISIHYCEYKAIANSEKLKINNGKNTDVTLTFLKERRCCNF
ncbi:hypothetical protein SLOPH_511 [Spraguea lophii 42_110]|uniref:Uncharacterized protein n=1 Tax=Spraguea lophii (strain 42_110) TaxID=1358809 RepID=S7XVI9_SPRLO|nr:hypothetical protein SLOPH_511 [Spraguea lophii 42_110]